MDLEFSAGSGENYPGVHPVGGGWSSYGPAFFVSPGSAAQNGDREGVSLQDNSWIGKQLDGLVPRQSYTLTAFVAYRQGFPAGHLSILIDGVEIGIWTPSSVAGGDGWTARSVSFVASSSSHALKIAAVGASEDIFMSGLTDGSIGAPVQPNPPPQPPASGGSPDPANPPASGGTSGQTGGNPPPANDGNRAKIAFVCAGDSITQNVKNPGGRKVSDVIAARLTEAGYDVTAYYNTGASGTTTRDWLPGSANLEGSLADTSVKLLFLMLGTNDAFHGVSPDEYRDNMLQIRTRVNAAGVKLLITLPPIAIVGSDNVITVESNARIGNYWYSLILGSDGVNQMLADCWLARLVDRHPERFLDGIHINQAAVEEWGDTLAQFVINVL